MEQLLQTVQDQAEKGEFDDFDEVMGELGGRPEDLYWKESEDGSLLVGDDDITPSTVGRVMLEDGELSAEPVELSEVQWGRPFISAPESGVTDPQFD